MICITCMLLVCNPHSIVSCPLEFIYMECDACSDSDADDSEESDTGSDVSDLIDDSEQPQTQTKLDVISQLFHINTLPDGDCLFTSLGLAVQKPGHTVRSNIIQHTQECTYCRGIVNANGLRMGCWGGVDELASWGCIQDAPVICYDGDNKRWQVHNPYGQNELYAVYYSMAHYQYLGGLSKQHCKQIFRDPHTLGAVCACKWAEPEVRPEPASTTLPEPTDSLHTPTPDPEWPPEPLTTFLDPQGSLHTPTPDPEWPEPPSPFLDTALESPLDPQGPSFAAAITSTPNKGRIYKPNPLKLQQTKLTEVVDFEIRATFHANSLGTILSEAHVSTILQSHKQCKYVLNRYIYTNISPPNGENHERCRRARFESGLKYNIKAGAQKHIAQQLLAKTLYCCPQDFEQTANCIGYMSLVEHLEEKHGIHILTVKDLSMHSMQSAFEHRDQPKWNLQGLYQRALRTAIGEGDRSRAHFDASKVDIAEKIDDYLSIVKTPGSELVAKYAHVEQKQNRDVIVNETNWSVWAAKIRRDCSNIESMNPIRTHEARVAKDPLYKEDTRGTHKDIGPIVPIFGMCGAFDETCTMTDEEHLQRLEQLGPQQHAQAAMERGNAMSNALFKRAILSGDEVFDETPHPVLPHAALTLKQAGVCAEKGLPCLLVPQEIATVVADLMENSKDSAPKCLKNAPCTRAIQGKLHTGLATFPSSMSIIESWMRASRTYGKLQQEMHQLCSRYREHGMEPLIYATSVEVHQGTRKKKTETASKGKAEPETQAKGTWNMYKGGDTAPPKPTKQPQAPDEQVTFNEDGEPDGESDVKVVFQTISSLLFTKGQSVIAKQHHRGSAHVHSLWTVAHNKGYSPPAPDIVNLVQTSDPGLLNVKKTLDIYDVSFRANSKAKAITKSELCSCENMLMYLLKASSMKRSIRALTILGSHDTTYSALVAFYSNCTDCCAYDISHSGYPVYVQYRGIPICAARPLQPEPVPVLPDAIAPAKRAQITGMKVLYDRARRPGPMGSKVTPAAKVRAQMRWVEHNIDGYYVSKQHYSEVDADLLNLSTETERDSSPDEEDSLEKLLNWLRERMTLGQSLQLIYHLSTYMARRYEKAPQILIYGVPGCGKTTLKNLLMAMFTNRCFDAGVESQGAFQAASFLGKQKSAIWLTDECRRSHRKRTHHIWALPSRSSWVRRTKRGYSPKKRPSYEGPPSERLPETSRKEMKCTSMQTKRS